MFTVYSTDLKNSNSIVRVETKRIAIFGLAGACSGFFVEPDKVVTNIHGITDRKSILVRSVDKKTVWKVEGVTAFDVKNDLVVLKVVGVGTPLPLGNSDVVQNGDPISVMGFPYGKYKVTEGTVQNHRDSDKHIRTKADISPGNSGSPVLNEKRQVIGIYSYVSNDSYSWAIPSNALKALLDQLEPAEPLKKWRKRQIIRSYAKYIQGKRNSRKERYRKAIVDLDKAIKLNPKLIDVYEDVYEERGIAKAELGDHEGAIADFDKAIKLRPKDASAYNNRGNVKGAFGDIKGEIDDYNNAIQLDPEDVTAYKNRGLAKAELGDFEGAISDYDNAIKLDPKDATAYYHRCRAKNNLGDTKGAIADYDKIIQLDADDFGAYCNRGLAKAKLGDVEGAITDYDRAIQLNADDFVAYNNRGLAKVELGDVEGAIADYDKAVVLNPKVERVYFNRARAYASHENYEAAITDYDKVIKLKPKDAKVYFNRALAKEALGQQDAAKADFDKAKELE